jgi:nitrile hydratase
MDGVHDLGGMQGFGPIKVDHGNHVDLADWEDRMWALSRNLSHPDWTIDWWRHIIERLPPEVYLNIPYFEKWMLTYTTGFITSGEFTADELLSGSPAKPIVQPAIKTVEDVIEIVRTVSTSTRSELATKPRFDIGQTVTTVQDISADHTRLPRYARGRTGKIVAYRGAYLLADAYAKGISKHEHHYTAAFTARELWGESASEHDTVRLDLWESYFVQT